MPVDRPTTDRAELSVAAFCRVLADAVQDVSRQANGLGDVSRIGFATQANSFTLLDERSEPLVPFILWTDRRARDSVGPIDDLNAQPRVLCFDGRSRA